MELETNNSDLRQEYLELTKKQTDSDSWSEQDRIRLLKLRQIFDIDQPLTQNQKNALHRQGIADTPLKTGEKPQPPLTRGEVDHILTVYENISKSHRGNFSAPSPQFCTDHCFVPNNQGISKPNLGGIN